jgi:hypothetical protein
MPSTYAKIDNVALTAKLKEQMETKYFELENKSK